MRTAPWSALGLGRLNLVRQEGGAIDFHVVHLEPGYVFDGCLGIRQPEVDVLQGNVADNALRSTGNGAETARGARDVRDRDVFDPLRRRGLPLEVEVLGPRLDANEGPLAVQRDVAEMDVLVVLGRVGAELEADQDVAMALVRVLNPAVFNDYVADVACLAAERDRPVPKGKSAARNADVLDRRALQVPIGQRSLASLQGDIVVVHGDVAAANRHVLATVDVDAVRAGCAGWRADVDLLHGRVPATVQVQFQNPDSRSRMPLIRTSLESWTNRLRGRSTSRFLVFLSALWRFKRIPVGLAAALDGSLARDAEVVDLRCVDQGRTPDLGVPFDAGRHGRVVFDVRRPQQYRALLQVQVDARLEEDRTG